MDNSEIRSKFSILKTKVNGYDLAYLDSAATSQKPQCVIDALSDYYTNTNANVHRGVHYLSEKASAEYEAARQKVQKLINATAPEEIVFTGNATEAVNLLAYSWGETNIAEGDEIIVSALEHHANFVPWQQLALRKNANLKIVELTSDLTLDYQDLAAKISQKTKLIAITGMSNVTGYKPNLRKIVATARQVGAKVLVDASQLIVHDKVDVRTIDCDFLVFTAHKLFGPTGLGILYGKQNLLEQMPPFMTGGGMIAKVTDTQSTWASLPEKFEAGTPKIAEVIAFGAAIDWLQENEYYKQLKYEQELYKYLVEKFSVNEKITLHIPTDSTNTGGLISFSIKGAHPHDIASIFDSFGIAIRAGHHCAAPLMHRLKAPATARISLSIFNTKEEIDRAYTAAEKVIEIFS